MEDTNTSGNHVDPGFPSQISVINVMIVDTHAANPEVRFKNPSTSKNIAVPLSQDDLDELKGAEDMAVPSSPPSKDRRLSKEWDASKVPPSRFQRRQGSIYSTPNSRDGHVKDSSRDKAYFDKLREKV